MGKTFFKFAIVAALLACLSHQAHAASLQCAVGQSYTARSGNQYTANAQGVAANVTGNDTLDLISSGCSVMPGTATAAVDPTTSNDTTQGFVIGSMWLNTATPSWWIAKSVGTGAAVWVQAGNNISLPGRATVTICGDGTTINNNTVYYGPSMVPVANGIRTCDTTQAGNVTEATAQAKGFDNTAFQVLSMQCLTADPGAAGVAFTLRDSSGATVPSVTCSVANTKLGCNADVQTTTAIAAGHAIAIAAASTGNQGTTPFACTLSVAY